MRIEHPYNQAFPPFCQAPLLRTNKPSITQQLLSKNSFTGTFTGTKFDKFAAARLMSHADFFNLPPIRCKRRNLSIRNVFGGNR